MCGRNRDVAYIARLSKRQRAGAVQDAGADNHALMLGTLRLLVKNGFLGVGEFFVAAVVAAIVDEFLGGGEIGGGGIPRIL